MTETRNDSNMSGADRFWGSLDGTPGEILWDADASDLEGDLERFHAAFGQYLPLVDLGCGDGRQTRFLAEHFRNVIGVDIAANAIKRAEAAANPPNVSYRVLDARDPTAASALHRDIGDANVYIRGVLHARPPDARAQVVETSARLLGHTGTLFVKELSPDAHPYFASITEGYGPPFGLTRVMQLAGSPGQLSEPELAALFPSDRFTVIRTGATHIETVNLVPDGMRIAIPAIYALITPLAETSQGNRAHLTVRLRSHVHPAR